MLEIVTKFTPFRMKLSRKEGVHLTVDLKNQDPEDAMISTTLDLGSNFSMEKTGYKTVAEERIPKLEPGESKRFYYEIWPKQSARPGSQRLTLTVIEHFKSEEYVKQEYKRNLELTVEE